MAELPRSINLHEMGLVADRLPKTPQQRFDEQYISTKEITERTGATRAAVISKVKKRFVNITCCGATLWERTPELEQFINSWSEVRNNAV